MSNSLKKRYKPKILNSTKGGEIKGLLGEWYTFIDNEDTDDLTVRITLASPPCIKDDEGETANCRCVVCEPPDEFFEDIVLKFNKDYEQISSNFHT